MRVPHSALVTTPTSPTKKALAQRSQREPYDAGGSQPHIYETAIGPCVQRPSRALLGSRQHLGETRVGKSTSARHRGENRTAQRMSSYGKRRTSRMLRHADAPPKTRGRAPLTQTCPADLACMPSKRGKARYNRQYTHGERRGFAPAPHLKSYSDRPDFQEESANDF